VSKLIVVISGKKGSGKNTFANMLAGEFMRWTNPTNNTYFRVNDDGKLQSFEITAREKTYYDVNLDTDIGSEDSIAFNGVRVLSFATLLKRYCMQLFGLTVDQCYGSNDAEEYLHKGGVGEPAHCGSG
jgi:energy-coupling factor transporter ATP-binding protein EcfA2